MTEPDSHRGDLNRKIRPVRAAAEVLKPLARGMIHAGHGTIRREHDQARSVFGVRQVAGVAEQPLRRPSARCGARRCTNRASSRENARGPRDPGRDNPSKRPGPGAPRAAHPAGPAARKCPDCWQININAGWDGGRRDIAERVFAPSNRPVILPGRSETCCNGRPGDSLGGAAASRSMLILLAGCSVPVLQPGPHHRDVRVPHRSGGPRDRAISLYVNGASEPTSHPPTYRQLACVQLRTYGDEAGGFGSQSIGPLERYGKPQRPAGVSIRRDCALIYAGDRSRKVRGPTIWTWPMTSCWPGGSKTAFRRSPG